MTTPAATPEHVGPYRLDRRLGRGGMGEVYAGYDERLDRPVALKRIRPGTVGDKRQKRFRREARAVARLHHPAIVQVHDLVETEEGDWIVMELVRGLSIRELLHDAPLPPLRTASIGRDVLEGLAVAHAAGVVHRDLKAENVMVSSDSSPGKWEQAKILDFGLAMRVDLSESRLSADGGLVGTLIALSPEQVAGREVDARSDLFSLGTLLYEMLTGRTPFDGQSPGEILARIGTWKQPPARTLNPNVPEPLSDFVDALLEKDPRRRGSAARALEELRGILAGLPGSGPLAVPPMTPPRSDSDDSATKYTEESWEKTPVTYTFFPRPPDSGRRQNVSGGRRRIWWAALAVVLLALAVAVAVWLARDTKTLYVAVPATEVAAPEGADLALAADATHSGILTALLGFRGVAAREPSRDGVGAGDLASLARATAADEILTSKLECGVNLTCQLVLKRFRSADESVAWTRRLTVDPARLLDLSLTVGDHLRQAYPDAQLRRGVPDLEVRAGDYEEYLKLRRRYDEREEGFSVAELVSGIERLERSSPRFLDAPLFKARVLARSYAQRRDGAELEAAKRTLSQLAALAPKDPRLLLERAFVDEVAGEPGEVEATLSELLRLDPGNLEAMSRRARVLEAQGKTDEAVERMREVVRRLPSARNHFNLGAMLYRSGDTDGAREVLEAGLARAPDNYDGLSQLAALELMSGTPARAVEIYKHLIELSPEETELTNLGTAYLLVGSYENAARLYRQVLDKAPTSPYALLSLADAELLRGHEKDAEDLYRRLLEEVGDDPAKSLLTVRAQALAHLGRTSEAVTAIQEALRAAPDHPMTAYEASLVFTLVGDQASALWNAERAISGGVDARWFNFPWFDPLRPRLDEVAGRP